ncbi:MAG: sigma-E factor negative regulatory protein [Gammaproteobacteria bacterium]
MNHEELSALVDGEVADEDITRLLDALGDDAGARRAWARYHVIGDTLRGSAAALSERSPAPAAATVVALPSARRQLPLGGLALAASVAVLAVALVIGGSGGDDGGAGLEVAAGAPAPAAPETVAPLAPLAPQPVSSVADAQATALDPAGIHDPRLNGYLVNFNEKRSRLGVPGVHPYVRIVGFEAP